MIWTRSYWATANFLYIAQAHEINEGMLYNVTNHLSAGFDEFLFVFRHFELTNVCRSSRGFMIVIPNKQSRSAMIISNPINENQQIIDVSNDVEGTVFKRALIIFIISLSVKHLNSFWNRSRTEPTITICSRR